jgi:Flp pilus assembly protein TadD
MRDERLLESAEGYLELGMLDEAARILDGFTPPAPLRAKWLQLRAEHASRSSDWPRMRDTAREWLELEPASAPAAVTLAFATRRCDSVAAAWEILAQAQREHPRHNLIAYNLACYAAVRGDLEDARVRIRKVLLRKPGFRAVALNDPDLAPLHTWIATLDLTE